MQKLSEYYRDVKNFIFLWRVNRDITMVSKHDSTQFIDRLLSIMREEKRGGMLRTISLSVILQLRELYPYRIQGYERIKQLYDEYFKIENHIESIGEIVKRLGIERRVYVTKFRRNAPIKGKRYSEYYLNHYGTDGIEVYRIERFDPYHKIFTLKGTRMNYIDEASMTCYRFSTKDEVNQLFTYEAEKLFWETKIEGCMVEAKHYKEKLSKVKFGEL
jgi:hypothetical protein